MVVLSGNIFSITTCLSLWRIELFRFAVGPSDESSSPLNPWYSMARSLRENFSPGNKLKVRSNRCPEHQSPTQLLSCNGSTATERPFLSTCNALESHVWFRIACRVRWQLSICECIYYLTAGTVFSVTPATCWVFRVPLSCASTKLAARDSAAACRSSALSFCVHPKRIVNAGYQILRQCCPFQQLSDSDSDSDSANI